MYAVKMKSTRTLAGAAAALLLTVGSVFAASTLKDDIEATLRKKLGNLPHIRITILGTPTPNAVQDSIDVEGIDVRAPEVNLDGLRLKNYVLTARGIRLSYTKLKQEDEVRTLSVANSRISCRIETADLARYLPTTTSDVKNFKVWFKNGKAYMSGDYEWAGKVRHLTAGGTFARAEGGRGINLNAETLSLDGVQAPAFLRKLAMSKLNPLLKTEELPLNPRFSKLIVTDKLITID